VLSSQYDRGITQPSEHRTEAEIQARQQSVSEARERTAQRDQALAGEIRGNTISEGGAEHVNQVFDHVTLGSGFAGVANEMSRPNAKAGDIIIGGANPWDGATSKFGQAAGHSEVPGARPEHKMTETVTDPTLAYMQASEHADIVAINKDAAGLRTYNGQSGPLEPGPKPDWPQFARDGGANSRMQVTEPGPPMGDGKTRWVYSKQTDVASGPGPSRNLDPRVLSPETLAEMKANGAFAYGDQGFQGHHAEGDVAVYGPGAAGAWVNEALANHREGANNNDMEWIGRHPGAAGQGEKRAQLEAINHELTEAKASGDQRRIDEAVQRLSEFTFEEAAGNGNLPRNRQEGAAFHEDQQKGHGKPDVPDGKISRRVVEDITNVTYEVPPGGTEKKVKIVGMGADGKEFTIWKDSLVLSIGQDPKAPGGPADLVRNYRGQLEPIYGEPLASGFRPIVGVQSEDGSLRLMGAAATPGAVSELLKGVRPTGPGQRDPIVAAHQDNLGTQAGAQHVDSKGVVPGFVMSERTIAEANAQKAKETGNVRLAERLTETADQQAAHEGGVQRQRYDSEPLEAKPVSEMKPEERQAARDKYPDQISALEREGRIPMPNGKASVDLMASITAATNREVALVRLPSGERVMILGGEHHVDLPEGTKIIAHTHPGGDLQFSHEDELALSASRQKSSVLIGADGTVGRFRTEDAQNAKAYSETRKSEQLTDPPLSTVRREQIRGDVANERLAHDFAYREPSSLTPEDHKFLESKGLKVGGVVHGEGGLDFVTFLPIPGSDAKPVIAFRGTSEKADVIDDLHPAGIGAYQMAANEGVIARTMADLSKYGPVTVVGHSLGGALAQMTAARFPGRTGEVVSFQSPGIPKDMTSRVEGYNAQQKDAGQPGLDSRHYHVQGDFVPMAGESFTPGTTTRFDRGSDIIQDNPSNFDWKYKLIDDHTAYPTREFVKDGEGLGKWPTGMTRLDARGPSSAADEQTNSRTPAGRRLNAVADALRGSAGRIESMFERFSNHGHAPREEYVKTWTTVRDQIDRGDPVGSIVSTIQSSRIHQPDKTRMVENLRQIEAAASVPDPKRAKPRGSSLDGPVQRKAGGEASSDGRSPGEIARAGTAGSGGALPHHAAIQRAFGRHDVSGVRAHVGGAAAESSAALGATAFAHGDAIAFASSPDLHTAAHEAAHVVQQRAGVSVAGGIDGGASDQHEKHADAVADKVVAGESAETLLDQLTKHAASAEAGVQRKMAGTDAISREMTSKDKAAEMLRHTPPENRGDDR
ncbi:MAG: DUF4157 domain-containing protein, partial [Kofleriaceae bacterium]